VRDAARIGGQGGEAAGEGGVVGKLVEAGGAVSVYPQHV